ncbi:hypothetical protein EMIT0232MI5_130082 [Pseudomonas sp. IT-232MI5]
MAGRWGSLSGMGGGGLGAGMAEWVYSVLLLDLLSLLNLHWIERDKSNAGLIACGYQYSHPCRNGIHVEKNPCFSALPGRPCWRYAECRCS